MMMGGDICFYRGTYVACGPDEKTNVFALLDSEMPLVFGAFYLSSNR